MNQVGVPAALFAEPALLVRVEECVHQVVSVVLRDLERLRLYTETKSNRL